MKMRNALQDWLPTCHWRCKGRLEKVPHHLCWCNFVLNFLNSSVENWLVKWENWVYKHWGEYDSWCKLMFLWRNWLQGGWEFETFWGFEDKYRRGLITIKFLLITNLASSNPSYWVRKINSWSTNFLLVWSINLWWENRQYNNSSRQENIC